MGCLTIYTDGLEANDIEAISNGVIPVVRITDNDSVSSVGRGVWITLPTLRLPYRHPAVNPPGASGLESAE